MCYYLIIVYHGGIEYYKYPSPLLQKKCRKFIDKGADFVTCQHSHCIGVLENYQEGRILYGQGNTLFGHRHNNDSWNRGLLVKLIFEESNKKPVLELIPIEATKVGIRKMSKTDSRLLLAEMHNESLRINNDEFIQKKWIEFCNSREGDYMSFLFGFNKILVHLNRLFKNRIVRFLFPRRTIRITNNIIRCESHNEVLSSIIKNRYL